MSTKIIAGNATNNGASLSSDTSGVLEIATGASQTTAVTFGADQSVTFAGSIVQGSATQAVPSGSAPLYSARAWVNFNGTGTVAIRASGNVSSITDNGVGDYTVNLATAMPDTNYAVSGCFRPSAGQVGLIYEQPDSPIRTTTQLRIYGVSSNVLFDSQFVSVQVFR